MFANLGDCPTSYVLDVRVNGQYKLCHLLTLCTFPSINQGELDSIEAI